jgi:hypothetical protein
MQAYFTLRQQLVCFKASFFGYFWISSVFMLIAMSMLIIAANGSLF